MLDISGVQDGRKLVEKCKMFLCKTLSASLYLLQEHFMELDYGKKKLKLRHCPNFSEKLADFYGRCVGLKDCHNRFRQLLYPHAPTEAGERHCETTHVLDTSSEEKEHGF